MQSHGERARSLHGRPEQLREQEAFSMASQMDVGPLSQRVQHRSDVKALRSLLSPQQGYPSMHGEAAPNRSLDDDP